MRCAIDKQVDAGALEDISGDNRLRDVLVEFREKQFANEVKKYDSIASKRANG